MTTPISVMPTNSRWMTTGVTSFAQAGDNESVKRAIPGRSGNSHSIEKLPSEALGSCTLRLTNIAIGSRYRVEVASTGALAEPSANAEGEAGASTVDLTLSYYAVGGDNNNLLIKVRKGTTATKYLPFETQVVAQAGVVTAYIAQIADTIA